jgi:hypothetical protein
VRHHSRHLVERHARRRDQRLVHRVIHLGHDPHVGRLVRQRVERRIHRPLDRVLDRHDGPVDLPGLHRHDRLEDRRIRDFVDCGISGDRRA